MKKFFVSVAAALAIGTAFAASQVRPVAASSLLVRVQQGQQDLS